MCLFPFFQCHVLCFLLRCMNISWLKECYEAHYWWRIFFMIAVEPAITSMCSDLMVAPSLHCTQSTEAPEANLFSSTRSCFYVLKMLRVYPDSECSEFIRMTRGTALQTRCVSCLIWGKWLNFRRKVESILHLVLSNQSDHHSEHGYFIQGGNLPVSFASLQYRSLRINAAALGCLCLVKTPFLFPYTRVIPADTSGINKKPIVNRSADTEERSDSSENRADSFKCQRSLMSHGYKSTSQGRWIHLEKLRSKHS